MAYLVDGHNLIPKISGMSLKMLDDELQLVELLQEFCRQQRKEIEVYFDNAPPGQPKARNFGLVIARFVRQGMTADEAIRQRLERLGKEARNWTVVSSDMAVQASARSHRARYISSEVFASQIREALDVSRRDPGDRDEAPLSQEELNNWLDLFGSGDDG